ncbi:MAG: diguanylate cyclase [Rhodoferax sp.]|uniref:diguanylate cyclase domain-containing protein n=1 Tax=Rhodoferax sp. TaxID=50421 RepID=UPI003018862C
MTLFTLVIFLASLWSLSLYASRELRNDMQRLLSEQQFSTIALLADNINVEMANRLQTLEKVAKDITPAMLGQPSSLQAYLAERLLLQAPFGDGIFVTRQDGTAVAELPRAAGFVGVNYKDRDYMVAALNSGLSTIGRPVIGKVTHAPIVAMSVPVFDPQGKVIGAITGLINLGGPNFLDTMTQGRYGKTGGYLIVAPQYRLIVTATDKSRVMEVLPLPGVNPQLDRFVKGFEGSDIFTNPQGLEVLASAKSISVAGWYAAATLPTAEAFTPILDMQQRMLNATLILTLLAGLLVWWMLRLQLSPMMDVAKKLAGVSEKDHPLQALPLAKQDEIGDLIKGFNHLLETLAYREEVLRETKRFLKESQSMAGLGSYVLDVRSGSWKSSDVFDTVFGIDPTYERSLAGWVALIHPADRAMMAADLQDKILGQGKSIHKEYRIIRQGDQTERWVHGFGRLETDDRGNLLYLRGTIQDITDRKKMEEHMRQLAFYDPLTKLPNRRLINDRLSQTMAMSKRSACHSALMFLDLDNFKPINDIHGHDFGDLLLIEVAARLKNCVREMDTVGRLGGDEFVVLINELDTHQEASIEQAELIAEKIRIAMAEPYRLTIQHQGMADVTVEHRCTASIGVVVFVSDTSSQSDILKWADLAMYQAKESGRNAIRFYRC